MRTRIADFLNTDTRRPERSFQYQAEKRGPWKYPGDAKGDVLTWTQPAQRDRARACFSTRRTTEAAYADLKTRGLI